MAFGQGNILFTGRLHQQTALTNTNSKRSATSTKMCHGKWVYISLAQISMDMLAQVTPLKKNILPIASMFGTFTHIWLIFMADVGKYIIHGCYGL